MRVERFRENPIVRPADVKPSRNDFEVVCAFNPAAVRFGDEVLLLLRVAERPRDKASDEEVAPVLDATSGTLRCLRVKHGTPALEVLDSRGFIYQGQVYLTSISHLRLARSRDGVHFTVDETPAMFPEGPYEIFGIEDPRITQIGDEYFVTYKMVGDNSIATGLAVTRDFREFERRGMIFCPENLDAMFFPEQIGGLYWCLHRPVPRYIGTPTMWIACSPDGVHWGGHRELLRPRSGMWDAARTGGSCVPIRTERGWLEIYHGVDETGRYSLGAVLLDLDEPWRVVARSREPLMSPEAEYERQGFFGNVVFSCGAVDYPDGRVDIYYGASDEVTAGATASIEDILAAME